jgi:hypothetical protein
VFDLFVVRAAAVAAVDCIVNYSGMVYRKGLGPNKAERAEAITSFNPDPTWTKVDSSETAK